MTEQEIRDVFAKAIEERNWYASIGISKYRANGLKRRFNSGELLLGKILETLYALGYKIKITPP